MEIKFGKIKPNNNIFSTPSSNSPDANFFATNTFGQSFQQENNASGSRMNDFDSNILENNAYQAISDEMFKLEHKMGMLETSLSKLTNEIEALESLGYDIQVYDLKDRKLKLERELAELNKKYSELGLGAKISGQIASAMNLTSKKKFNPLLRLKKFLSKKVLSKISKKFDNSQTMKEALENLCSINLSVDELIKMQTPYGETMNRYDKLTAYLNKANVIHSQISRMTNKNTNARP